MKKAVDDLDLEYGLEEILALERDIFKSNPDSRSSHFWIEDRDEISIVIEETSEGELYVNGPLH